MEFAIPGFIKNFCTPNALTTLMEYLIDYASPETRAAGEKLIAAELAKMDEGPRKKELVERLRRDPGDRRAGPVFLILDSRLAGAGRRDLHCRRSAHPCLG